MASPLDYRIRAMLLDDIPDILIVQDNAYSNILLEDASFFSNRLELAPAHCWVAVDPSDRVHAYLIAYPWSKGGPPTLNVPLDSLPQHDASWFLHDCAVHAAARGAGLAKRLITEALGHARVSGFDHASLVSLKTAIPFWQQQGYASISSPSEALVTKLSGYGAGAAYMTREILLPESLASVISIATDDQ